MQATRTIPALLTIIVATVALSACDRAGDNTTAGQKVDRAIASTERSADHAKADIKDATANAKADIKDATADARKSTSEATTAVADTARDLGITAKVNAELAKDSSLSAIRIDVDTKGGNVSLSGTAPDEAARKRAESLATGVEGVVAVDNRLVVAPKS
ncbi:MAG: BON domain-containing protein [Burkholderiaceae bacterium]